MCPVEKRVWGESNECGRNLDETLMAFKGIEKLKDMRSFLLFDINTFIYR
jgi:hypothetical protein